jgi:peptidyl-prolyl cis-trans isomerase A (cyclophilin A)
LCSRTSAVIVRAPEEDTMRFSSAIGATLLCAAALTACKESGEGAQKPATPPSAAKTQPPAAQQPPAQPPAAAQPNAAPASTPAKDSAMADNGIPQGNGDLYAKFETSEGNIVIKLFEADAPKTVANFAGLATGKKQWRDPRSGQTKNTPLYDGTVFHRVIPQFMIQGGDPLGTGTGDPGYRFEDEFQSGRRFDKPGLLAMANAGPNTNGSQFFITEVPTPHLNNRHTIFGEVVKGQELIPRIARKGNAQVKLNHVELTRSTTVPG